MRPEDISPDDKAVVKVDKNKIPDQVPILPLNGQVAYPTLNMALAVPEQASSLIETAMKGNHLIGIVGTKSLTNELPLPGQVFETGTVVRVLYVTRAPNNSVLLVVHGMKRFRITEWVAGRDFLTAKIELAPETIESDIETEALHRSLRDLTQEIFSLYDNVPNEAIEGLTRIRGPLHLAYIAAAHSEIDYEKRQALLEEDSLKAKLRELVRLLSREKEILSLGQKIKSDVHDEMNKSQRNFYLRQQLKAIKKELGEMDEDQTESDDYQQRIAESDMTDEARKEAMRELSRLEEMSPQSAEYSMVKTYIEWLLELPWNRSSEDQTDIGEARAVLDKDHYGLQGVKDRIIEYLAVRNLLAIREINKKNDLQPICFQFTAIVTSSSLIPTL